MPLVRWVTNIPTPYRNHGFAVQGEVFGHHGLDLEVWYQAWSEPDRHWRFTDDDLDYPHRVWPGWSPRVAGVTLHLNPSLLWALRRRPADVVIVGGWAGPTQALAPLAAGRRPLRLLASEANPDSSRTTSWPARRVRQAVVDRYDGYVVPGQRSAELLRSLSPRVAERPFLDMANLVDESVWRDQVASTRASRRDALRSELGVTGPMWLTLARLEHRKGLDALLTAMAAAPHDVTLVVGGTGSEREALEAQAERARLDVRFLGQVGQDRVVELMAAADLFALPSRIDPNPLSPIEAAAAGLPLLLSGRAGNVDDLVVEGETGWRFEPDDPAAARRAVERAAAADVEALASMGERAADLHRRRFDSVTVLEGFAASLAELLAHPHGTHRSRGHR